MVKNIIIIIIFCLALIGAWIFALTVARADTTPPDGIILINNNATTVYSRTVNVLIPAQDNYEIADMCVGVGACTWEPYAISKQIQLTGTGNAWYSICERTRDRAGNESVMKCVAVQYIGN
jgi:hypothetical protein